MSSLIINLPYSSCSVPQAVAKGLGLSENEIRQENWQLCDPHLGRLIQEAAGQSALKERTSILYPYSPVVADPLGLWAAVLGSGGVGPAILPRGAGGKEFIWQDKDRDIIFSRTVEPYFQRLEEEVDKKLSESAQVLVLTLRSFSSMPFDFEASAITPRPQLVIESDPDLTPNGLANFMFDIFRAFHWWAERVCSQTGAAWLPPSLKGRPGVKALGLSLCRGLYMDEHTGLVSESATGARRILSIFFNLLEQELERSGRAKPDRRRDGSGSSPVIKAGSLENK